MGYSNAGPSGSIAVCNLMVRNKLVKDQSSAITIAVFLTEDKSVTLGKEYRESYH
jgi:hypothetical protein